VIVNTRFLKEKPELIRKFLRATQKGAVYALENREDAARITSKYRLNTKEDFESLKVEVDLALELLHTENTIEKPIGWSSSEDWKSTLQILTDFASLNTPQNPDTFYTNAYLADIKGRN
jgi:ABC-type nitrate/sulfonate/bicarbonate transport system substrate-binding protein